MAKWRVINMHPLQYTHKEMFKGEPIEIKYGQYVLMDYEDAVQFRGQFFPMLKDANDQPDPKGFKVLKLEPDVPDEAPVIKSTTEFICQIDGKKFSTQAELDRYVKENHADKIFVDEELEKELAKDKKIKGK